jgi:hypothetical protein
MFLTVLQSELCFLLGALATEFEQMIFFVRCLDRDMHVPCTVKEYRIENQIWSFITMEKKLVQSILLLYTGFFFHVQVTKHKMYPITRKRVMNNI